VFYKAIGYAVWKLAVAYLRQRFGRLVKPGAAAAVAGALLAVYIARRNDDE
jgi:hypothetical protein